MVGLRWSGYYDGWTVLVRVLRWFDCGGQGTTIVGLQWWWYYDGWTTVVRVLRWLDCVDEGTTMVGLWCSG